MNNAIVEKILKQTGIEYLEILKSKKGYRNYSFPIRLKNSNIINLIFYKNEDSIFKRIQRINTIGELLSQSNLPVRVPLKIADAVIMKLQFKNSVRFACFYNYLQGETIEWEHYTRKHIKLLGMGMARLHREMRNEELGMRNINKESRNRKVENRNKIQNSQNSEFPIFAEEMLEQIERIEKYFIRKDVQKAAEEKLGISLSQLNAKISNSRKLAMYLLKLNSQILHLDFVRGNILFLEIKNKKVKNKDLLSDSGELIAGSLKLSGILDFEKAAYGPPIVDIARTLAFLVTDCSKYSQKQVLKYFLDSGYVKRGGGQVQHIELLKPLMYYFWIYDFYKFLHHNPYENLQENYHYKRTVRAMGGERWATSDGR